MEVLLNCSCFLVWRSLKELLKYENRHSRIRPKFFFSLSSVESTKSKNKQVVEISPVEQTASNGRRGRRDSKKRSRKRPFLKRLSPAVVVHIAERPLRSPDDRRRATIEKLCQIVCKQTEQVQKVKSLFTCFTDTHYFDEYVRMALTIAQAVWLVGVHSIIHGIVGIFVIMTSFYVNYHPGIIHAFVVANVIFIVLGCK